MASSTVTVDASKALAAFRKVEKQLPKEITKELRKIGRPVAKDARDRFSGIDSRTASKFRARAFKSGVVVVENPLRKTTGDHGGYGALQMERALVPALEANEGFVRHELEALVERVISDNDLD